MLGTSVWAADASCLTAPVTSHELHECIKQLEHNQSPGVDGVLSGILKDGSDVLHS